MDKEIGIFTAAEIGIQEVLTKKLTAKNVNSKGPFGRTCLIQASMSNQPSIVQILLKAGADVKLQCQQGMTALDWATHLRQQESI